MTTRAGIYARISGDDRRYATSSVEGQLADCRKYAAEKGYTVVREFCEDANKHTSGTDWLPQLDQALKLAKAGGIDVLIVKEIDRLARNRFKQMATEIQLESYGVRVEYVKGQFEDTPEGRLLKGLMAEFAEYEREKIRARMMGGSLRSVKSGNVKIGPVVTLGYDVVTKGKQRTLAVNDEEAAVVRLIFDLYVNQDYTIYAIAQYLDEHGIPKPSKTKKVGWSHGTIRNILTNETYIGRWYYRKSTTVKDPRTGKSKMVKLPKDQWIMVEVPAIISEELFQAAAQRLKANRRRSRQRKNQYSLGGMLTCGHCGHSMSGITRDRKFRRKFYVCNARFGHGRYRNGLRCDNPFHFADDTEAAVWKWVKGILLSPELLQRELDTYAEKQREAAEPLFDMLSASQRQLDKAKEERDRLIRGYTAGVLTLDEIAAQKQDIDRRISDLTAAISSLEAEIAPKLLGQADKDAIKQYAAQVHKGAELLDDDLEGQHEVYRRLRLKVTLTECDGERWADVECVLGKQRVQTTFNTVGCAAP